MIISSISFLVMQAFFLWISSLWLKDSSLMDRFWGSSFVVVTSLLIFQADQNMGQWVLFSMVCLWGCRLSFYISQRNWGKGEDPRYLAMRNSITSYPTKSLYIVFLFQGALVAIIALPLLHYFLGKSGNSIGGFEVIGIFIWAIGFITEIFADRQLKSFKKNPNLNGKVLCQGLWALSRHPNYLGEALVWWGLWLYTFSWEGSWTIVSPILITWLLRYFTGVEHLERHMIKKRPSYREYQKKVPVFWPKPIGKTQERTF